MQIETGLLCVGRFAKAPGLFQNPNNDRFDQSFSEYLLSEGIEDKFMEYGIARPTLKRELKAVSRYGLPTVDKPPTAMEQAKLMKWLHKEFGPLVDGNRVLSINEIEVQGHTTPGIPYKWYYQNKRETLLNCQEDIKSFWKYAHVIQPPLVWHNFCKIELLKTKKLDEDNIRSITGPDVAYYCAFSRLCQDFNKKLYSHPLSSSSALGVSKFYGGMKAMAQKMLKHPHKEEADMSKYDARLVRWLMIMCRNFRWETLREEDQTSENWQRLEYYYEQAIHSYFATTMGFILEVDHGIKSGFTNTTADNTIIHFIIVAYSYMNLVSDDYNHFKANVELLLYGDDEGVSMSDSVVDKFSAEMRAPYYERCGVHFKVEETVESTNLEGLTFLGTRFLSLPNGEWAGTPVDPRKCLASLLKPPKKLTPGQSLTRAVSLLMESYWHKNTREIIHGYVKYLVKRGVTMDLSLGEDEYSFVEPDMFKGNIPTLRVIRDLWLGLE